MIMSRKQKVVFYSFSRILRFWGIFIQSLINVLSVKLKKLENYLVCVDCIVLRTMYI